MSHVWLEHTQDATQHPANGYVLEPAGLLRPDRAEALVQVLTPLVEAAVAPLRSELADTRTALESTRQELGCALAHPRAQGRSKGPIDGEASRTRS
jgi:hypothetical protein